MNASWDSPYYKYDCKPYLIPSEQFSRIAYKTHWTVFNHDYDESYYYVLPSCVSELDFLDYVDYTYGQFEYDVWKDLT